jgi:hypothetical protein
MESAGSWRQIRRRRRMKWLIGQELEMWIIAANGCEMACRRLRQSYAASASIGGVQSAGCTQPFGWIKAPSGGVARGIA